MDSTQGMRYLGVAQEAARRMGGTARKMERQTGPIGLEQNLFKLSNLADTLGINLAELRNRSTPFNAFS
jgi:hypothetical protein